MHHRVLLWVAHPEGWALAIYHRAHRLWRRNRRGLAMLLSALARIICGVEIHPGAVLEPGVMLVHALGLTVGEPAEIGTGTILLQGVTIGGIAGVAAMPRIGRRVLVGANACILGGVTIGDDAKIGAGAVVLCGVPAGWTAVGNPARLLPPKEQRTPPQP